MTREHTHLEDRGAGFLKQEKNETKHKDESSGFKQQNKAEPPSCEAVGLEATAAPTTPTQGGTNLEAWLSVANTGDGHPAGSPPRPSDTGHLT